MLKELNWLYNENNNKMEGDKQEKGSLKKAKNENKY